MESFYQTLSQLGYTHPVHPTMVYLPIGCVMAAFIFSITAALFNRTGLMTSARHCITLALISVLPTIFFGYTDWHHFLGGSLIVPIKMKMILAAVLLLLLVCTTIYSWRVYAQTKKILLLHTLCFITVTAIGFYGGEIVFAGFGTQAKSPDPVDSKAAQQPKATVTYSDIAGILDHHCIMCHTGPGAPYSLELDTYEHVMKGGVDGKVIVPGKPGDSELIRRIRGESDPAMPFMRGSLPADQIEALTNWVQQGAKP